MFILLVILFIFAVTKLIINSKLFIMEIIYIVISNHSTIFGVFSNVMDAYKCKKYYQSKLPNSRISVELEFVDLTKF